MADPILSVLLENLNTLILKEFGLLWGVDKDRKKLESALTRIQAVLDDAEEKQLSDKAIRDWLRKLRYAAYELEDILDDCSNEVLKWEYKRQSSGSLKKVATSLLIYPVEHIIFLHKIGTRMKAITEELDAIADEKNKYNLQDLGADKHLAKSRETDSFLTESLLLGRDEDKEKIIKVLVEDVCDSEDLPVYPIVGMGGLGKTTLTRMVFNDERVASHFEPRIWVYVSQKFDSKRLIKATIESVTGKACEVLDLDPLKRRLRELLDGKRYLIALDDVWNDNQEEWNNLKSALACGAKGASLIVTTRLKKVAAITGTVPPHHLSSFSDDDCWLLFKQRAFGPGNEERPNLVTIGKEIVKKCGGVPLAAKALGGLLRFTSEEKDWLFVKESKIWNLPHDENSILPALRLSYNNLPLEVRRCFAYCATFPKGSEIGKEQVIHIWIANGYVSGKDERELEDIGGKICNELLWRSFFEVVDRKRHEIEWTDYETQKIDCTTWYKMHDLLHDLAGSVMKEGQITGTEKSSVMFKERFRCVPLSMLQQENHKACFPFQRGKSNFKKFGSLRVVHGGGNFLILFSSGMRNLPSSIGNLKHLRYLDISRTDIKQLPDSICSLWNLQTLILDYCKQLERLPKNMNSLRGLRHLYLTECPLSDMPPKIGQLTCLKTLSLFVVGKSMKCSQLAELQRLNLGGQLCIEHLERVRSPTDAKANLVEKKNLCFLELSWGSIAESESQENVEEVLEALEPHPNLKGLIINNYGGTRLPLWRRNTILENIDIVVIEVIELINCKNCFQLPPLGQLPLLRRLKIEEMDKVEYIDGDLCCVGPVRGFPSLEKLEISRLPNLKGLSREEGGELLPRLCKIKVWACPKLRFPCLSSPKVLEVWGGCTNVVLNSISNLNSLTSLDVDGNEEVICFPIELLRNLTLLESLKIERFSKLKMFPDELASLVALKSLYIRLCQELVAFPEGAKHLNSLRHLTLIGGRIMLHDTDVKSVPWIEGVQHIPALESLDISNYYEITSLPDWLGNLTSLQSLRIWDCPKIASLPASIQGLTKLNELDIRFCSPELKKRCQRGTGEDWDKIAHIPRVLPVHLQ